MVELGVDEGRYIVENIQHRTTLRISGLISCSSATCLYTFICEIYAAASTVNIKEHRHNIEYYVFGEFFVSDNLCTEPTHTKLNLSFKILTSKDEPGHIHVVIQLCITSNVTSDDQFHEIASL